MNENENLAEVSEIAEAINNWYFDCEYNENGDAIHWRDLNLEWFSSEGLETLVEIATDTPHNPIFPSQFDSSYARSICIRELASRGDC